MDEPEIVKLLNLKEQFRYLVEHGVSDHGMSIGDAVDLAYDTIAPKLAGLRLIQIPYF